MMSQSNISESRDERANLTYGKYEGGQEYTPLRDENSYAPLQNAVPGEKVYQPLRDNTNMFRFLVFVISMATLLVSLIVCLALIGGTAGWIGFCAASFAILVIASTFISMKPDGGK